MANLLVRELVWREGERGLMQLQGRCTVSTACHPPAGHKPGHPRIPSDVQAIFATVSPPDRMKRYHWHVPSFGGYPRAQWGMAATYGQALQAAEAEVQHRIKDEYNPFHSSTQEHFS